MLAMPSTGPAACAEKAQRQPTIAANGGTSWIETIVRRKPSEGCTGSAVPTACGGTLSVTSTENCALSAMTKNPQRRATGARSQRLRPKVSPMTMAQAPLTAIASVTSHSRPLRSAAGPPPPRPSAGGGDPPPDPPRAADREGGEGYARGDRAVARVRGVGCGAVL